MFAFTSLSKFKVNLAVVRTPNCPSDGVEDDNTGPAAQPLLPQQGCLLADKFGANNLGGCFLFWTFQLVKSWSNAGAFWNVLLKPVAEDVSQLVMSY